MFLFRKNLFLLTVSLLCLIQPLQARKKVIELADYGIHPNSISNTILCEKLSKILSEIKRENVSSNGIEIKFEKGTYHLYAANSQSVELYVSNHDQGQPKRIGIYLKGWKNLTINGNGSQIICHGRMLPLTIENSIQCSIKNLCFDFADPQIAQVQVVKNSSTDGITFEVAPEVNYRIAPNGKFETYGEGWTMQQNAGIAFERDTRHIVYRTSDIFINTQGVIDLGGRQMHAPQWKDDRLIPGTIVAMRTYERPAPAIFLKGSSDTKISNVKVHYAEGMGLVAQRCTNITLKKFSVCLRGEDDIRYFTTQADATHFVQCRGKITVRNGLYEGMMDDAINVHGIYLRVTEKINNNTLLCTFGHNQAWGFSWGDIGDTVRFVRSSTMEELDFQSVITSILPNKQDSIKGCKGFLITLKDKIPQELEGNNKFGIENITWTPEVTFSHNIVRNNRARGALFSSPRRTVCEKNLFDHTSGTAILLCGDCNGWFESGAVHNLVIRENTFVNALTNLFQFTNAIISIYPEIPNLDEQKNYFHGGNHDAIRIEHNYFDTFDTPLLYAKSVRGLIFRHNEIKKNDEYKPFHPNQETIKLEHCIDTTIETD